MYVLNERQSSIVMDLVETKFPITAKELASKYDVSIRTIRYDLEIVESWMEDESLNFIKKPKIGMWLDIDDNQRESIKHKLGSIDPYIKFLSKDERKRIILEELIKASTYITGEYLCEKVGISRTTLVEDLNEMREEFEPRGILIEGKPSLGYIISGNEENIRELIGSLLLLNLDRFQLTDILKRGLMVGKNDISELENDLKLTNDINIEDIKHAIKMSKSIYDFWIPDSSYISLLIHIAIAIDRLLNKQKIKLPIEKIKLLQTYKEYGLAKEIAVNLERIYNITIPEAEIANITFHLISANLKLRYLHGENIYDIKNKLYPAIDKMTNYLRSKLKLSEESFNNLKSDLLSHLKLTIKKMELNIENTNPLLDKIKENYSIYYDLAEKSADIFKEVTGITLGDDEIGYIALHIAAHGELCKEEVYKKVLLVCTTGKGVAKILKAKLQRNIPELIVKDTVSIFEIEEGSISLDEVDFIISTFPIPDLELPVININPIVTEKDIIRIRNFIYDEKDKYLYSKTIEESYVLDSLMGIISKYIDIEVRGQLKEELSNVLEFIISNISIDDFSKDFSLNKVAEEIALIMVDIGTMLEELKDYLGEEESYIKIWGLAIHLVMAIPRWRSINNDWLFEMDSMTEEQQNIYEIVSKHVKEIARRYNLSIPNSEIISIVKYFI